MDYFNGSMFSYERFRTVLVLSDNLKLFKHDQIPELVSHLIGIGENLSGNLKLNFDNLIKINDKEEIKIVGAFYNILEDIYTDIRVFYTIPLFSHLFYSTEAKKRFSKLKVDFARRNSLKAYGEKIDTQSYISLLSCTRISIHSKPDFKVYEELWKQFFFELFFSDTGVRRLEVKLDQCIQLIKKLKDIGGQISEQEIQRKYSELESNKYYVFARTKSKIKDPKTAKSVANLFGRSIYKIGLIKFFELHNCENLIRYREHHDLIVIKKVD